MGQRQSFQLMVLESPKEELGLISCSIKSQVIFSYCQGNLKDLEGQKGLSR